MIQPKEINMHRGAKKIHKCLRANINLECNPLPPLSTFLVPVFMDLDPEQGIEEEYKNKHNQLFCWRTLRSLAEVDLRNFSGEGQASLPA